MFAVRCVIVWLAFQIGEDKSSDTKVSEARGEDRLAKHRFMVTELGKATLRNVLRVSKHYKLEQ